MGQPLVAAVLGDLAASSLSVFAAVALVEVVFVAATFGDGFADGLAPFDALLLAVLHLVLRSDAGSAAAVALPAALVVPLSLLQL